MPLHHADHHTAGKHDDIYALAPSDRRLSKYRIPDEPADPSSVYNLVHDELLLDGNSRQNLATFCTTWAEPEAHELMDESIDKNMIDKDEYPQTAEIEKPLRPHDRRSLARAAARGRRSGCSTTGSSEACMLGGLALKWQWRKRRHRRGQADRQAELRVRPGAGVLGEVRPVLRRRDPPGAAGGRRAGAAPGGPAAILRREHHRRDADARRDVHRRLRTGRRAGAGARRDSQRETDLDIPIHVDAASGGFIAPFIQPELEWDFRIERVKSINASGHKYGLAPLGVGWVVWRDKADLPEELIFNVDYLGGNMPTFALNFSRPGGADHRAVLQFPAARPRRLHAASSRPAPTPRRWLAGEIAKLGPAGAGLRRQGRAALRLLQAEARQGPRLHAVRPVRPGAHARLADRVLPAAGQSQGHDHPAHSDPPRRQPRPGASVARGDQALAGPSARQPHPEALVRTELQPQLTKRPGASSARLRGSSRSGAARSCCP